MCVCVGGGSNPVSVTAEAGALPLGHWDNTGEGGGG